MLLLYFKSLIQLFSNSPGFTGKVPVPAIYLSVSETEACYSLPPCTPSYIGSFFPSHFPVCNQRLVTNPIDQKYAMRERRTAA
jgi:hypothetical protein